MSKAFGGMVDFLDMHWIDEVVDWVTVPIVEIRYCIRYAISYTKSIIFSAMKLSHLLAVSIN